MHCGNFFLPLVSLSAQDIFRGVFTINFLRQLCLSLTCKKYCTNIGYNCKGNSIDIFPAFSSRDVDMICENWHTHLNCTLGAHCSSCKAAGRILHFCKPLQFMKRSIYVLVVEDQKSINDMHDYTIEEGLLEVTTECYAKDKVKSPPFFRSLYHDFQSYFRLLPI